jgi:glucose/arabinose dehydrogenase
MSGQFGRRARKEKRAIAFLPTGDGNKRTPMPSNVHQSAALAPDLPSWRTETTLPAFMSVSLLHRGTLVAVFLASLSALRAAETVEMEVNANATVGKLEPADRHAALDILPASDEAQLALKRMKLPAGLTMSLWAAEPMLANPVAINFDEHGRLFVAETYRYRSSVLDIRDYMWSLEDDLANRTLADQSAGILRHFGPEGVKELSQETEVVRLLEDRGHTGKADFSTVYADGFNSPLDGIAAGVLARRGKVWFTNIPSVWMFEGDTHAEKRTELSRGYGIRFNYTGHDLHGLIFGPDGKIYFSVGDRGAHVPTKEGGVVDSADMGSVFRCNPARNFRDRPPQSPGPALHRKRRPVHRR